MRGGRFAGSEPHGWEAQRPGQTRPMGPYQKDAEPQFNLDVRFVTIVHGLAGGLRGRGLG